jgi:hypothetical protein
MLLSKGLHTLALITALIISVLGPVIIIHSMVKLVEIAIYERLSSEEDGE